jgi:hypothetical protein
LDKLIEIADQFNPNGPVWSVREHGSGNVNDTYLVTLNSDEPAQHFILQRVNTHVFKHPELIMVNMRALSDHVASHADKNGSTSSTSRRWEIPHIYTTRSGDNYYVDAEGRFWRAMSFIERSTAYPRIQDTWHAAEAGYALGRFQSMISDLSPDRLHDTLVGFHITPGYLRRYDQVLAQQPFPHISPDVRWCMQFVERGRMLAPVLEDAKAKGLLPIRPMHGDPKIDNIMIDDATHRAVSIVDLDTVKPGLVQYDIGDCLRSCCNPLGEETEDLDGVRFDPDLCREILNGYLAVAESFFNQHDYGFLYDSIRLISFELGLRFFTDHLEGNVYFKARHAEHNLQRALVQFRLAQSIENQESVLRKIIDEKRPAVIRG